MVTGGALSQCYKFFTRLLNPRPTPLLPSTAVDFFVCHGGYKRFKKAVVCDLQLLELMEIEEELGSFEARFKLTVSWYDPAFDSTEWDKVTRKKLISYNAPEIKILDVVSGFDGWYGHNNVAEIKLRRSGHVTPRGIVHKELVFTTVVRDENPIHMFPFDMQELTIEFEIPGSDTRGDEDYLRYFMPLNISVEAKHEMLEWEYHQPVIHNVRPQGEKGKLIAVFRVSRKYASYVVNVMVICGLLAQCTIVSWVIPVFDMADRSSVTLSLLLTIVAYKLVLTEMLPKVAYLTYIDYYVLACFGMIFVVFIQNLITGLLVGVDGTMTCGSNARYGGEREDCRYIMGPDENGLELLIPEDSLVFYGVGGSLNVFEALKQEKRSAYCIEGIFLGFNLSMFFAAYFYLRSYKKEYGESYEPRKNNGRKRNAALLEETQGEEETGSNDRPSTWVEADKMDWGLYGLKVKQYEGSPLGKERELNSTERKLTTNSDIEALEAAIANCGLSLEMSNLPHKLFDYGMTVADFKESHDTRLIDEQLAMLSVPLEHRRKLIVQTRKQVDVLFLQGSASYLMIDLKLDGQLVTKSKVLATIEGYLRDGQMPGDDDRDSGKPRFNFKSFQNLMYGRAILNSSATNCVYIISKRECRSTSGKLYTQLWAGYADSITAEATAIKPEATAMIVDIGSGEIKGFFCTLKKNTPVKLLHESDDYKLKIDSKIDDYTTGMNGMKDDIVTWYLDNLKNKGKEDVPPPGIYAANLKKITDILLSGPDDNKMSDSEDFKKATIFRFVATASTRKFFSDNHKKDSHSDHKEDPKLGEAMQFAKHFIIEHIEGGLKDAIDQSSPAIDGDANDVKFHLLSQASLPPCRSA